MSQLNNQLNSELILHEVPRATSNQPNSIIGLEKLNKDSMNSKVVKVGDKLYVCELQDGELTKDAKKFIQSERIKLWHKNHNGAGKKKKHCSSCRCEENVDENGNRIYAKRGPKGPHKQKKSKNSNKDEPKKTKKAKLTF